MAVLRPFRHLCPEADERDAMDDGAFWVHVSGVIADDYDGPDLDLAINTLPCATCGESGACAYDSEGRALIHATEDAD